MMIDKSSTMSNKNIFLDYLKYKPQSLEDCIMALSVLKVLERKTSKILYIKKMYSQCSRTMVSLTNPTAFVYRK